LFNNSELFWLLGEKMKNNRKNIIFIILLVALLVSSTFLVFNFAQPTTVSAANTPSQNELLQYDWPQLAHDDEHTRFSAGPAPDQPNLVRALPAVPSSFFNGEYWYVSGNRLYARDAFTDTIIVNASLPYGGSQPTKLDDTYLFLDISGGVTVHKISDGSWVSVINITQAGDIWGDTPGSQQYTAYGYSSELKWRYRNQYNMYTHQSELVGLDLSNPQAPRLGWRVTLNQSGEILCCGDGKVFEGTTNGYNIIAFNGTTGEVVWDARKIGFAGYSATYYEGKLYHFGASTRLTCYDGNNGTVIWDYDAGGRAFSSYGGCAAYGRVYWHCIDPYGGYVGCWDAETGQLLWKTPAWYSAGYIDPAIADGKLYYVRSDGSTVAGRPAPPTMFTCFDAFSGTILWEVAGSYSPIIAYGNLYLIAGTGGPPGFGPPPTCNVYSTVSDPQSWSYFRGNTNTPGVTSSTGPSTLNLKWTLKTDGAITSSPVVVDGKAYVGSYDKNWYCVDANTGSVIWKFPIAHEVQSTAAVVGGKMYTGADDGYFYCIDAITGTEIWKTNIYAGNVPQPLSEISSFQPRSSPIIVGDKEYIGALDGKVYCLDTSNGAIKWSYQTGDSSPTSMYYHAPIMGSPAYANNVIYITSTDKNLYAFDASSGTKLWNWTSPKVGMGLSPRFHLYLTSTPTVAEGKVFFGIGASWDNYLAFSGLPPSPYPTAIAFVALNASTGNLIWLANQTGNSEQPFAATYYKGVLFMPENMGISCYNATDGTLIWRQWLGHQVFTSVAVADDPTVGGIKLYAGSDSYSITCFNGTAAMLNATVSVLSEYTTGAQCPSSPAVYDGKLYAASADGNLYCFDDTPMVTTSMFATSNKGTEMWNNETLIINGTLTCLTYYPNPINASFVEQFNPGLPNATVTVSFTKPNIDFMNVTLITDSMGRFSGSFDLTDVGDWGWVAYYEGQTKPAISYSAVYSEWNPVSVVAAPQATNPTPQTSASPQETATSTVTEAPTVTSTANPTVTPTSSTLFGGMPIEYLYVIIVAIVVVVIAVVVYTYTKRGKK
jgi:outer membrane protein assembly factor BamB